MLITNGKLKRYLAAIGLTVFTAVSAFAQADMLPSWKEGRSKKAIIDFVAMVTKPGSTEFVPIAERIASFDNDGTLWAEQPMYFQFLFAMDRVRHIAPRHPEWEEQEPFKSLLAGDLKGMIAGARNRFFRSLTALSRAHRPTSLTPW